MLSNPNNKDYCEKRNPVLDFLNRAKSRAYKQKNQGQNVGSREQPHSHHIRYLYEI